MKERDKEVCFIASVDRCIFIIPEGMRVSFDETPFYDRYDRFYKYLIPEDAIIENIFIDETDLQAIVDGDY